MANRHKFRRGGAAKQTHSEHEREVESEGGVKRGGAMKGGGKVHGGKRKGRFARGGGVGADKHPFSSAYRASTEAK